MRKSPFLESLNNSLNKESIKEVTSPMAYMSYQREDNIRDPSLNSLRCCLRTHGKEFKTMQNLFNEMIEKYGSEV